MTENTNPLLSNTGRGFTVSYRGRFLYSAVDPEGRAERIASSVPKEEQTLYLIPSPLLFYGCKTILKNLPQTSRIFCVEADEALMSLSLSSAETIIEDERVSYIRTADPLLAGRYLEERIGAWRFRRVRLIPLNGGYALYKTVYDAIEAQLDTVIQTYWRNRMTLMHMGPLWVKNVFLNLIQLPHTLPLSALHTEQPVWVAGAGESLERALPLMKAHREEFFLIAVDTALPCLTQSGITPDLILALEAQYANLKDFIGFANRSVPLCADISSFPGVLRLFQGNKFLFASRFADTALLSRLREHFSREHFSIEELPPLGSVGVVAVKIGLDMTEAPLIVSGLDFSYTPGKTHSRGAPVHTAALSAWTRI
ncbi:MAG TPA: DUF115 domain-containing protein, partial [Spirochaetia bacterium]|nr:DUF115 domain-containing protein [Spirochaetia bacterium]